MTDAKRVKNGQKAAAGRVSKRPRRKRRRLSAFAWFLIIFSFCCVTLVFAVVNFLQISSISVAGKTAYTSEQILAASGLKTGGRVFGTDFGGTCAKICEKLPYIKTAKVSYNPLKGVLITVDSDTVSYKLAYEGGFAALDKGLKVLEVSADPAKFKDIPVIEGAMSKPPSIGKPVNDKDNKIGQASNILDMSSSRRIGRITRINIANGYEIKMNYDNRIDILIGTPADISYKLEFAAHLLNDKNNISDSDKGLLDVSQSAVSKRVSFIPA